MTLSSCEIRKKFLDFFASKGHRIVASDSVVPKDDPTVLFTTAGMQQFKRQFLGYIGGCTRAASSQKCLRTDDLDKVGKTDFHHTFFEMLGNFSFGDYFKKDAICWAWEFLTKELKIPAEKLWVSVYTDDDETEKIWLKDIKIDPQKLVRLGDKSNFWPAEAKEKGPNGPCGPCSEIFYDYGVNPKCTNKKCDPDCNCGRFSEIWNLVFTQFNRQEGGVLEPLPNKNIDTGMGLERLVAVVQGKKSNYETDLFAPIIAAIDREIKNNQYDISLQDKRIIADHIRAIVFGISDGVIPSNEGRGYVIKRLIIDAADKMIPLGKQRARLYQLVSTVVALMREPYRELLNSGKEDNIRDNIRRIQESYLVTRNERIPEMLLKIENILNKETSEEGKVDELGKLRFFYRDTHGLTDNSIAKAISDKAAVDSNFAFKINSFLVRMQEQSNKLMDKQREKSRAGSKMTGDVFVGTEVDIDIPKTKFEGYEHTQSTGKVLRLFIDNQNVKEVSRGDQVKVVLDKTPFYAEAGGQIGDTGYIIGKKGKIRVEDTQKFSDVYVHRGVVEEGLLRVDETVETKIDVERRSAIMRHHTATHLLQAALREVLGTHVQQQGSLVAEDRLRFDFSHPQAISREEIKRIEDRVNANVIARIPVQKEVLGIEEAKKKGALAFFAEKYGEKVRVVSIGDVSKEFCGGTHLKNTGEIGTFKVTSEGAVAQGIRRLEAKTGKEAELFIQKEEALKRENIELAKAKERERELEKSRFDRVRYSLDTIVSTAEIVNNVRIVSYTLPDASSELLRKTADLIKQKVAPSAVLVGTTTSEGSSYVIAVTPDLENNGIKANEVTDEVNKEIPGGSGGGQPRMAQAGSKDINWARSAMEKATKILKEKLKV
ncbi:MAG: alanine--tRNA ligase [Omnitrophica WOR_2 bacterium RIFCSPHIGHO2_01_FULL_52_10]|nr:MAG: alanine--tRNA ligase [Omnitrophica WOR_2 bacterium RIFCSPHIGHO2_01_FULL_52_10]